MDQEHRSAGRSTAAVWPASESGSYVTGPGATDGVTAAGGR